MHAQAHNATPLLAAPSDSASSSLRALQSIICLYHYLQVRKLAMRSRVSSHQRRQRLHAVLTRLQWVITVAMCASSMAAVCIRVCLRVQPSHCCACRPTGCQQQCAGLGDAQPCGERGSGGQQCCGVPAHRWGGSAVMLYFSSWQCIACGMRVACQARTSCKPANSSGRGEGTARRTSPPLPPLAWHACKHSTRAPPAAKQPDLWPSC